MGGFGLLLFAAFVSIGAVFVMKGYSVFKHKIEERQSGPSPSPSFDFGHKGCGIPHWTRLTKWRYMEIYIISFSVGIWQLGAISSYSIHLYCKILGRMFASLAFVGLAEEATAECYNIQASLPENLGIILGSFGVLLVTFIIQAYSQYKKNISESLRWIDNNDIPHLSLAWSHDKTKNTKYYRTSSVTASASWDYSHDSMGMPKGSPHETRSKDTPSKSSTFKDSSVPYSTSDISNSNEKLPNNCMKCIPERLRLMNAWGHLQAQQLLNVDH